MRLPIHLDVPDAFRARAAYAVETMLGGKGAEVISDAEAAFPLSVSADALDFFASEQPYDPARAFLVETAAGAVPVLFGTPEAPDFVASAFFWLSGWQERTGTRVDRHGRFPFDASLQHALGLAHLPVVDAYAEHLARDLEAQGVVLPGRAWGEHAWALCPTHDIDATRKWDAKSIWRGLRSPATVWQAVRQGDPYRRGLVRLMIEEQRRGVGATYYLKAGRTAPEDHDYPLRQQALLCLFAHDAFEVGLHPSYHAFDQPGRFRRERARLTDAALRPVAAVRHHYLRYRVEATPALHDALGFQTDSTLGWAEHEGWRRGTCRPFRVFDLTTDRATNVWEMPLALMDATLFGYRNLGAHEAWRATERVLDATRRFGGVCVALWHNTVWDGEAGERAGAHFLQTLEYAQANGALVTSVGKALESWKSEV